MILVNTLTCELYPRMRKLVAPSFEQLCLEILLITTVLVVLSSMFAPTTKLGKLSFYHPRKEVKIDTYKVIE